MADTITTPKTGNEFIPNPFDDDYCDCEDRCKNCGKKKKNPWHPIRYTCDYNIQL